MYADKTNYKIMLFNVYVMIWNSIILFLLLIQLIYIFPKMQYFIFTKVMGSTQSKIGST